MTSSSSSKPSRRLALVSGLALLGVFGAASVCSAESPWRRRPAATAPPPYTFALEDAHGAPLSTFRQGGRVYVLGEPGDRYNIRIHNPTSERVEVVLTVDGRDAVSGQIGDYLTARGYLLDPWASLLVEGFRRNLDEVAAFRFSERGQSYSALRGTPENVGVIGVAFFPEQARPRPLIRRRERRHSYEDRPSPKSGASRDLEGAGADHSSGAEASRRPYRADDFGPRKRKPVQERSEEASNIGTEYGESRGSSVIEIPFERRSPTHPAALLTQRYDDYAGLEARGIDLSALRYAYRDDEPQAFPRNRFAQPP